MTALRLAIVGFGKIARDQHVPAIAAIAAEFDFRQTVPQSWDILVETAGGPLQLSGRGARLVASGEALVDAAEDEYRGLHRRFCDMTATGASDVDLTPFRLVADAFMLGRRRIVEAFEE